VQRPLNLLEMLGKAVVAFGRRAHVVAQVVEAEFVVRPVSNIAVVGLLALGRVHVALNGAHAQSQRHVERSHPLHVAPGQIVVDGDHVYALALQGVEIRGQRGHQRLALAGDHLGDGPAVQDDAAHELHVEMAHAQFAPAGLAADCEGLDQQIVDRLAFGQSQVARIGRAEDTRSAALDRSTQRAEEVARQLTDPRE